MEQSKLHILCFQIKIFHKEREIKPKVLNYSFWEDSVFRVKNLPMQWVDCLEAFCLQRKAP